jgi:energy-coupling factor transport system ATP-binding protein
MDALSIPGKMTHRKALAVATEMGNSTASGIEHEGTRKEALRISDFSFSYPDGTKVLSRVNLSLEEASFTLLTGATGCGKTTLLKTLKPEIAPHGAKSGRITIGGRPLDDLDLRTSSQMIGYVAQSPESQIVCDTVWHELAFGLENLGLEQNALRRRVAEVAHFFGIGSWMHEATATLSGGQKQALVLASVLVMQPKLLLLDEPTAELDPVATKNFLHALFRVNREQGITVLVATHSPEAMADYATGTVCLTDISDPCAAFLDSLDAQGEGIKGRSANACGASSFAKSARQTEALVLPHLRTPPTNKVSNRYVEQFAITANDVYLRYARETPWVLRGADLTVAPGSIHALVGGNGSGKSTLLRALGGILKCQRGKVRNSLIDAQAFLPQDAKSLFVCDSVEDELHEWQHRGAPCEEDLAALAREFGLDALYKRHPYDLSGGQQLKLALAKLLLTKPQLLLLDEPTKGLDTAAKCEIADILAGLREKGVTIVVVSHDLAFVAKLADAVSMLFDGELTCTEPTDTFFLRNLFYRPLPDAFTRAWPKAATVRGIDCCCPLPTDAFIHRWPQAATGEGAQS